MMRFSGQNAPKETKKALLGDTILRPFEIQIDSLGAAGRSADFDFPADMVTKELLARSYAPASLVDSLTGSANITRAGGEVHVKGRFSSLLRYGCVRCLDQFETPLDEEFEVILTKGEEEGAAHSEVELSTEDLEVETEAIDGDSFDLASLVVDQLLLALPDHPVCGQECKGMCPHCGGDLNRGDCQCDGAPVDPRFAILEKLKKK
jgi:uncharacterized protein